MSFRCEAGVATRHVTCISPSSTCSGVSAVTTMANSSSRPSLPHHARKQRLIQDDMDPSVVDKSHHTRGAGAGIRYSRALLARISRACVRIVLTGSDGDADTVVRPSARPRVPTEFPPRMPRGCRPGGSLACPVGAPLAGIIRTRRCGRGPEGRHGRRWRDGVDIRASGRKGLGRGRRLQRGGGEWARGSWLAGGDGAKPLPPRASCSVESEPGSVGGASAMMR